MRGSRYRGEPISRASTCAAARLTLAGGRGIDHSHRRGWVGLDPNIGRSPHTPMVGGRRRSRLKSLSGPGLRGVAAPRSRRPSLFRSARPSDRAPSRPSIEIAWDGSVARDANAANSECVRWPKRPTSRLKTGNCTSGTALPMGPRCVAGVSAMVLEKEAKTSDSHATTIKAAK